MITTELRAEIAPVTRGWWLAHLGPRASAEPVSVPGVGPWRDVGPAGAGGRSLRVCAWPGGESLSHASGSGVGAVFDGVLYDRAALALELAFAPSGPAETGRPAPSDAELVLAAYGRHGRAAFERLRGVYALLIWDAAIDTLWAARDTVGLHPLFHSAVPDGMLFSNAQDALLASPGVSRALNRAAIVEHMSNHWWRPEETYYTAIRRVPSGHLLALDAAGERLHRLWDPIEVADDEWLDEPDQDWFDGLLAQAVARATEGRKAGIFLSGGFDSVSIACVATDQARQAGSPDPLALSLVFPDPESDESDVQGQVATALGIPQILQPFGEAIETEAGLMATVLDVSRHLAMPMQNPWRPAYLHLAARGRAAGCRTILTGNGGDDWLAVSPFLMADLMHARDFVGLTRFMRTNVRSYNLPRTAQLRYLMWQTGLRPLLIRRGRLLVSRLAPGLVRRRQRADLVAMQRAWLAPGDDLRRELAWRIEEWLDLRAREPEPSGRFPFYIRSNRSYLTHPLTAVDHEEEYEVGRRLGVPLRHPYWDLDLVHGLCRVSPWALQRGGREKGLVRAAVHRRFPTTGFQRHRKVSAGSFFVSVVRSEGAACRRALSGTPSLVALGIADGDAIDDVLDRMLAPDASPQKLNTAWQLLNIEAWLQARA